MTQEDQEFIDFLKKERTKGLGATVLWISILALTATAIAWGVVWLCDKFANAFAPMVMGYLS